MMASVPVTFDTTAEGHLEIDGCDVVDLVAEHGAPLWVISEATIRANYRRLRDAFRRVYPAATVLYATKANPEPAIIRVALSEGAMVDAVTLGHMRLIERAGGRPEQIVFNGNSKTEAELRFALDGRFSVINVDSLAEMQLIPELAPPAAGDACQPVCLRVAFDNTRVTGDDGELAGYEHLGKFGMDTTDLLTAAEIARRHPRIELAGLHNHLGYPGYGDTYSPKLDLQRHVVYLTQTLEAARTLREHGDVLRILNVGGGYRVGNPAGFGPGQPTPFPTADGYAEAITGCARDLCAEWGLGSPELILEAGGYLVSDAVALIARLGGSKTRRAGANNEAGRSSRTHRATTSCDAPCTDSIIRWWPPAGCTTRPAGRSRSPGRSAPTTMSPSTRPCLGSVAATCLRCSTTAPTARRSPPTTARCRSRPR